MRRSPRGEGAVGGGTPQAALVATASCEPPPLDRTEWRWRRRPVLAAVLRTVIVLTPLAVSSAAGVAASRLVRPVGWLASVGWLLWTAAVSLAVLAIVDALMRRLLPLPRLLQLCLVFPDRAPSRLRLAVQAARSRRPEALADTRGSAAGDAARRIVELLAALSVHDRRTRGHSERVCAYTELLAEQMGLDQAARDRLMWVALVHDIGKLEVPRRLLNKPGRPTVAEWQVLQAHPERGAAITAGLREWLGEWADAVAQHHERYDGTGYPQRLTGAQLCLGARIIAVTDAFEVMTAPRAYRRSVDAQSARAELARHAGTQFDPDVVRHFLAVGLPELRRAMGLFAWLAQLPFIRDWPRLQSQTAAATGQAVTTTATATSAALIAVGAGTAAAPAVADAPAPAPAAIAPATARPAADAVASELSHVHRHEASKRTSGAPTRPGARAARSGSVAAAAAAAAPQAAVASRPPAAGTGAGAQAAPSDRGRHRGWTLARERRAERADQRAQGPRPH